MGSFKKKIDHFASLLVKKFCLAENKYINTKYIQSEICEILYQFLVTKYEEGKTSTDINFPDNAISDLSLLQIVTKLQYPLMVVKTEYIGDKYGIDLKIDNIDFKLLKYISEFFVNNADMFDRNLKSIVAKKINKVKKKEQEKKALDALYKKYAENTKKYIAFDAKSYGTYDSISDSDSNDGNEVAIDDGFEFLI